MTQGRIKIDIGASNKKWLCCYATDSSYYQETTWHKKQNKQRKLSDITQWDGGSVMEPKWSLNGAKMDPKKTTF